LCRKIIGARWYIKGYEAEFGKLNLSDGVEFLSPRDAGGHGTHTSSTATGGLVENASFMGLAQGLARGGAPLAWLAVYEVFWDTGGCAEADLLAALMMQSLMVWMCYQYLLGHHLHLLPTLRKQQLLVPFML
jgi:hypothetical protein